MVQNWHSHNFDTQTDHLFIVQLPMRGKILAKKFWKYKIKYYFQNIFVFSLVVCVLDS